MSMPSRPHLKFNSFDDLLADVNQLHAGGWDKSGQWSLAMMSDHLAKWINGMLDRGFPRVPGPFQWIARAVIRRMASKQKYPSFTLHAPSATKPSPEISEPAAVAEFRTALARLQPLMGPTINTYPFGAVPLDDFRQLTLLHAAHHLSFLRAAAHA